MDTTTLAQEAAELAAERERYMDAKQRKAKAENEVLGAVLAAVKPALPAISSSRSIFGVPGNTRCIHLGGHLYLDEHGGFLDQGFQSLTYNEVLARTSPATILSVLSAAIRAQRGKLEPRRQEILREAGILEGIAAAFKVGGVK